MQPLTATLRRFCSGMRYLYQLPSSRDGGTGRRSGLKIRRAFAPLGVRFPLPAPITPALAEVHLCVTMMPTGTPVTIPHQPQFLDEAAVRARLRMPALIDAMEQALVEFSAGRVQQPVRTVLPFADTAFFGAMPAYVPSLPALGAKLVTVCPGNADRGVHTHQALIVLLDPATGVPQAILDGRYITEARTAAVSAVSVRHLARPDAKVLAIIGSGVQARSHFEALRLVRNFREVRVWSPNAEHRTSFAREIGARALDNAEVAVRDADVIAVVTSSPTPVVNNEWVAAGAHIVAVGACVPAQRELDPALVARARLIVDSRAAALKESGDIVMGIAEGRWTADYIVAELGELPKRRDAQEITIFKSLGLAVEDLFAAHLVLNTPA